MSSPYTDIERQFEEYLRDGISAAKSGQRKLAQSLLNRAIYLKQSDARPYIWLSATTDDPKEQIEYLERAVAIDPTNAAARRGLALLTGKIDRSRLLAEGQELDPRQMAGEVQANGQSITCPRCGGRMAYDIAAERLTCEYCGHVVSAGMEQALQPPGEQVLDFVMPTTRGHRWAGALHLFACERCGAQQVLPPGHKTAECSYCGSNHLVASPEQMELVEPEAIALMKVNEERAIQVARRWLGSGFFAPDNLLRAGSSLQLRPAYYSCWLFDGTVELRWTCEVADGSRNSKRWIPSSGVETRFFNDVLVSGVKAISEADLDRAGPFNLEDLADFKPDCLAGWPAILYDTPLSDASLDAREEVVRKLRPQMYDLVEMGREKRNLNIGSGSWSGITFKHILLPLWVGSYTFQGKPYRLLVNGQTGKAAGDKPRDSFKLAMSTLTLVMFVFLLIMLLWLLFGDRPLF
jgi:DNA-directed RNA polymerase subunit RPC12/RpoP